jgi:glyoxylase-like metal-dependent hydrolase (beta-lactamase superfamily II)
VIKLAKIIENAVQQKNWSVALPRPEYQQWPRLKSRSHWFEVYELPNNVYALYESGHFQEVISFLICGSERALLFDTGLGIGDIKKEVDKLTKLETIVVNSHFHFDHIGGNYQFPQVYIFSDDFALKRLAKGYTHEELRIHLSGDSCQRPYPASFNPANYCIPPAHPAPLYPGDIFDLGSRTLKILHTPGHTPDSIMLFDMEKRSLFTGDTIYPAALYAHYADDYYGYSDFETYRQTIGHLSEIISSLDYLYCSHNVPLLEPQIILRIHDAFAQITDQTADYRIDAYGYRRYDFTGFAIII